MRVEVDRQLCEGHARCEQLAPEVFTVGDDDQSHVRIDVVPESMRDAVQNVIHVCPRQAVRWASSAT